MSDGKLTPEQAQLHLQLYDLRREARLRQARDWFFRNFFVEKPEEVEQVAPMGSEENAYMRMVLSYWDQACALLNMGVLNQDLFFETSGEFFTVWERIKPIAPLMRERYKNPHFFTHLEKTSKRYEEWQNQRAPGFVEVMRQFAQQMRPEPAKR